MPWRRKTFDEVPALSVRGPELRNALRTVTVAWMFGITWMTIVTGSRGTIFGEMLGFDNDDFGILTSLPFAATFLQVFAAVLIERTGVRKWMFIYLMTVGRLLWVLVALIPLFFPIPSRVAVWTMLGIILAGHVCNAFSAPAWMSWMGDLIPRRIRGRYLGNRQRYSRYVQIPLVVVISIVLDFMTDPDQPITAADQPLLLNAIMVLFAFAAIAGALDILLFLRIREVVPTTPDAPRKPAVEIHVSKPRRWNPVSALRYGTAYSVQAFRSVVGEPLGDRDFRRLVLYLAVMTSAATASGPFIWRNALKNLQFSQFGADILYLVIGPLAGMLAARSIGNRIDRWGRRPTMFFGTILTVFSILPMFIASPRTPNPVWLIDAANGACAWGASIIGQQGWTPIPQGAPLGAWLITLLSATIGAVGWTTVMMAQAGILMGFSDGSGRSKYVAASSVLISFGGMFGSRMGGWVAEALRAYQPDGSPMVLGTLVWTNWHATFALSWVLRLLGLFLVLRVTDPGSRPVRRIMYDARSNVFNYFNSRLFYRMRIFGWDDPDRRWRDWSELLKRQSQEIRQQRKEEVGRIRQQKQDVIEQHRRVERELTEQEQVLQQQHRDEQKTLLPPEAPPEQKQAVRDKQLTEKQKLREQKRRTREQRKEQEQKIRRKQQSVDRNLRQKQREVEEKKRDIRIRKARGDEIPPPPDQENPQDAPQDDPEDPTPDNEER